MHILDSTSVPFTLATVQVPNIALTHTKRTTVQSDKPMFILLVIQYCVTVFTLLLKDLGFCYAVPGGWFGLDRGSRPWPRLNQAEFQYFTIFTSF